MESKSPLDLLVFTLESFISELKDDKTQLNSDSVNYDSSEFMREINALSVTLSHECTKFTMILTDGTTIPTAKTIESLSDRLIDMTAALYKISHGLPTEKTGIHFRRVVWDAAIDVFRTIRALAVSAKEGSANLKIQLRETGTVWEACDKLKALPKDSRELLTRNITETLNMVNDAYSEIDELSAAFGLTTLVEVSEDDDTNSPSSFNEQEKIRLDSCKHLVKAAKATLTKMNQAISGCTLSDIVDDEIISTLEQISPLVDNIVSSFYDIQANSSEELAKDVDELCKAINLILINFKKSSYYEETHDKWMNILFTGVEHNLAKYHNANESMSKT